MQLSHPEPSHWASLHRWFGSQASLTQWGGPGLLFTEQLDDFVAQIQLARGHSRVLLDENGVVCGFGQCYVRLGRHHFGRLAIDPGQRGRGLGKRLLTALLSEAPNLQQARGASLFVYPDNLAAIGCYRGLGFQVTPYPDLTDNSVGDCLYMTRD